VFHNFSDLGSGKIQAVVVEGYAFSRRPKSWPRSMLEWGARGSPSSLG
jgi:hypothetical protein